MSSMASAQRKQRSGMLRNPRDSPHEGKKNKIWSPKFIMVRLQTQSARQPSLTASMADFSPLTIKYSCLDTMFYNKSFAFSKPHATYQLSPPQKKIN